MVERSVPSSAPSAGADLLLAGDGAGGGMDGGARERASGRSQEQAQWKENGPFEGTDVC